MFYKCSKASIRESGFSSAVRKFKAHSRFRCKWQLSIFHSVSPKRGAKNASDLGQTVGLSHPDCHISKERRACIALFVAWCTDWQKPYRGWEGEERCPQPITPESRMDQISKVPREPAIFPSRNAWIVRFSKPERSRVVHFPLNVSPRVDVAHLLGLGASTGKNAWWACRKTGIRESKSRTNRELQESFCRLFPKSAEPNFPMPPGTCSGQFGMCSTVILTD